ncbi:MAG: Spy/CpxP family protein refolding chaperone [Ignavibacteriaceae bacterium]|nr:Spy/CpxP family protein refolding chaperone [Ignavibacteriaceae bacterium]
MKLKIYALIAVISVMLISQDLFAQEKIERQRNGNKSKIHQKLNLTKEQQVKVDALRFGHQKDMIDLKANLEKKEVEMAELKNKGNYTREDFLNKVNEIISAKNKIALSMANHQMDAYQLLDENQKKEWNKFSGNFREKREKRIMKMMKNTDVE